MSSNSLFSQHLYTNYAPSAGEINHIRSLVDERQKAVDALDVGIAVLVQRRDEHAKFIKEHSDLLSPIRRVSDDILSLIFLTCLPRNTSSKSTRLSGDHPALIISRVCQRWRHLSLNTPLLWAVIDIKTPWIPDPDQYGWREGMEHWGKLMQAILALTRLWITRSADCPLTVAFSGGLTFSESPNLIPEPVLAARGLMSSLVNTLCDASYRWKSVYLSLQVGDDEAMNTFFQIPYDKLPLLETVNVNTIVASRHFRAERSGLTPGTGLIKAPRLRRLGVASFSSSPLRLPIKWANLTELSLGHVSSYDDEFSPLSVLPLCTNVTRCSIDYPIPLQLVGVPSAHANATNSVAPNRGVCRLPKLQTLELRGFEPPPSFVAKLDLPSLRKLNVLWSSTQVIGERLDGGTIEVIRKFGHGLTDVRLEWGSLNGPRLCDILQNLPNVINLTIGGVHEYPPPLATHTYLPPVVIDSALEKLTPRSRSKDNEGVTGEVCCCPKLKKFGCKVKETVEVSEETFSRFIASRRNRLNGDVALLTSFVAAFPSRKPEQLIRGRLEEMGVDLEGMVLITAYKRPKDFYKLNFITRAPPEFDVDSETGKHEDFISTVGPRPVGHTLGEF